MVSTPKLFGIGKPKPVLDIRPDSAFVVFRGDAEHAEPVTLTGTLVLDTPETTSIRSIYISLNGGRKVFWIINDPGPQNVFCREPVFREKVQIYPPEALGNNKAHQMGPGIHRWRFSFKMMGNLPESVEGLGGSYLAYNLHAKLDRGVLATSLYAEKHLRVIRTLGSTSLAATALEQESQDIWANKLLYRVTLPQYNYIYGTRAVADVQMIPLKEGVKIGKMSMELREIVTLTAFQGGRSLSRQRNYLVADKEFDMPADARQKMIPGSNEDAPLDESYKFQLEFPFPRSLRKCRPSVDVRGIKIEHKIYVNVDLENGDGHLSTLTAMLNCFLFISPNLPIGDDQQVLQVASTAAVEAAMHAEATQAAPPTYGDHHLDQLFDGIDPSGCRTPGGWPWTPNQSGPVTPYYMHSRRNSSDDFLAANSTVPGGSVASPSQLHSRLAGLSITQASSSGSHSGPRGLRNSRNNSHSRHSSGSNTPHHVRGSSLHMSSMTADGSDDSRGDSCTQSHASRDMPGPSTQRHSSGYDVHTLSRTPSYNTALRTPLPSPATDDPPTYEWATSRPATPAIEALSGPTPALFPTSGPSTLEEETERNTAINRAPRP